ncbi:MAG: thiamine phosphate synthase [Microvirga sp.]
MAEPATRLFLITPLLEDASFAPRLSEACGAGDVAAVLLALAPSDERTLINRVKALAPAVQEHGAAAIVGLGGDPGGSVEIDLAAIAARGGADGVHLTGAGAPVRGLRERLKGERAVGVGGLRSRDDAMTIGETGADYLMFGEPRADGSLPSFDVILERAAWWSEIFEPPAVAYAPSLSDVPALAATGIEFVALRDAVWSHPEGPASAVRAALAGLSGRRTDDR